MSFETTSTTKNVPRVCTLMPLPAELQALGDELSVQENPLNARQVTTSHVPRDTAGHRKPSQRMGLWIEHLWSNHRTIRVRILNGSETVRAKVRSYALLWVQYMSLSLEFVESGDAEIRVNIDASGSSWSVVGTACLAIKNQTKPTMNLGWLTDESPEEEFSAIVLHEFGHALGCIHEHQSPNADINWDKPYVYWYYEQYYGWSRDEVDKHIFYRYPPDLVAASRLDPLSIMMYPIPLNFTTDGFVVGWNTVLSDVDKTFIGSIYPRGAPRRRPEGVVSSNFNTLETHAWDVAERDAAKRVHFPTAYDDPPTLALGLNWLDAGKSAAGVHVSTYADGVTKSHADVHIAALGDTKVYSAASTWYAVAANDRDVQTGVVRAGEGERASAVEFARAFSAAPKVVVWLAQFDLAGEEIRSIAVTAADITPTGFTVTFKTEGDTVLRSATATWIAYSSDKKGVVSGSYSTKDVRPSSEPHRTTIGGVDFPDGALKGAPELLLALNSFHVEGGGGLHLRLGAHSVSRTGFNWSIDGWEDTVLHSAGASFLAFA